MADVPPPDPTRIDFAIHLAEAIQRVERREVPSWLADAFIADDTIGDIMRRYGIKRAARNELLALLITFDRFLAAEARHNQPRLGQRNSKLKTLKKADVALRSLQNLSDFVDLVAKTEHPDGSVTYEVCDAIQELRKALQRPIGFLENLKVRRGRSRKSIHWAQIELAKILREHAPSMSKSEISNLSDDIFSDMRHRHGDISRADPDLAPRHHDVVRRVVASSNLRVRKIRQKSH